MKHILTFILFFIGLNFFLLAQTPTAGLQAHYKFNGNANDSSGNANHGSVSGASLTTDRNNKANSAYSFDGNDIISFGRTYDLLPRSVSIWFSVSEVTSTLSVMYSSDNKNIVNGMTAISFKKINNLNKIIWNVANVLDTTDISLNTWHHSVITVDSGTTSLYLDCQLIKTIAIGNYYHSMDVTTNDQVGASRANSLYFKGKIDDVRIYNRVLDSNELDLLCMEGLNTSSIESIKSINNNSLEIYPNPAKSQIHLVLNDISLSENYQIKVINALGQIIELPIINAETRTYDVSLLSSGFYTICLFDTSNQMIANKKILIE